MSKVGRIWKSTPRASVHPTNVDIAWAAGIYEGEGTAAPTPGSTMVAVGQADRWILDRFQRLFGGSIYGPFSTGPISRQKQLRWVVYGSRARGFLMTVYLFLSPRRQEQALRAMRIVRQESA